MPMVSLNFVWEQDMHYVLIGNSYAAVGAIEAIRRVDREGRITVISDEVHHCYARPLITFWLGGSVSTEHMYYRPRGFYEKNRVSLLLGRRVQSVDTARKRLDLDDGSGISYGKLLIATGGTPVVPPIDGFSPTVKNVHTFTAWDDAKALKRLSAEKRRAVVIGGGLIGLKASEGLNDIGVDTTIVELGPRVLSLALDEYSGRIATRRLNENGIKTITGTTATRLLVNGNDEISGVVLDDGTTLPCDILVLAIGVRPNAGFLEDSGIHIERGVVTDTTMATNISDIYAAGDVAQGKNVLNGESEVIAIVPVAYEQGKVAGYNMAGISRQYSGGLPMNSVEIYGLPIMSMGITRPNSEAQWEECVREEAAYRKFIFQDNRLVGALLVGNVDYGGVLTHIIRGGGDISPLMRERMLAGENLILSAQSFCHAPEHRDSGLGVLNN